MGRTGDPPVPSGHWPDGTSQALTRRRCTHNPNRAPFPFREAGRRTGQAESPVLPVGFIKATPEFGLKVRIVRDSAAVGTGRYNKAREMDAVNTGFNHRTSCVEYSCSVRRMPTMISLERV